MFVFVMLHIEPLGKSTRTVWTPNELVEDDLKPCTRQFIIAIILRITDLIPGTASPTLWDNA